MEFLCYLLLLLTAVLSSLAVTDNLTTSVTWDHYSLMINGERVFIYAGEFHYARLPVPELWRDVFEKFKANGLNAVSIYFFWSYHEARRGAYDFETSGKNVQRLLDTAKEVGLYVIARPGPYTNAETNGGGLALWGSDGSLGLLRTSNETYHQAWLPWINEIGSILAKNQITNGGPVILLQIENELQETTHSATNTLVIYMEQIEQASRDVGIVVPFTSNEKGQRSESWSIDFENVGGSVNVYGLDSYPLGASCTNINSGFQVIRNYYQWFQNYSSSQPEFFPEFESGYFQPWGGYFYDDCLAEHDPAFADVYYKNNIGQRTTLQSMYMAFGGTNWGNLGAPVVYTSYDYSAPLRETREVQAKFKQIKLIGLFARSSGDLLETNMESNGTGNSVNSTEVFSWVLRNPNNGAGFYTFQQNNTASRSLVTFSAYLTTSAGLVTVPNIQLDGRQSKIVTTDYRFGQHTLLYSSADILTYGLFDVAVLVLYLEAGQVGEFALAGNSSKLNYSVDGTTKVVAVASNFNATAGYGSSASFTRYTYTQTIGSTVLQFSNGMLVYLLDTETAWTFHAPATRVSPLVNPADQVFALGPYLVRGATFENGTVHLIGDNANRTQIEVFAGSGARSVTWNGEAVSTKRTTYGSLVGNIAGAENRTINLPAMTWVAADSLPEKERDYDDSNWTVCDKMTTLSPIAPLTLPVLFSSDYGFYVGAKIYRGYFDSVLPTFANVTAQGGLASGWSAWLNGQYVGGSPGNASLSSTSAILDLTHAPKYNVSNVLTIVVDYTGHDETSTSKGVENPRGLLGATLQAGNLTLNYTQWKIQGNAGGSANIDPVRGPLNEDGLHGTRLGWHLPGFDPIGPAWSSSSPLQGLNASGISYYISRFSLDIDKDLDVPLGVELNAPEGTVASVQIYMNGYQYGKYIPQIGPQTRFPFPPGVVNNRGPNTLAISIWAQTETGARLSNVTLFAYNTYQAGFNFNQDWDYLQPRWDESRLSYA